MRARRHRGRTALAATVGTGVNAFGGGASAFGGGGKALGGGPNVFGGGPRVWPTRTARLTRRCDAATFGPMRLEVGGARGSAARAGRIAKAFGSAAIALAAVGWLGCRANVELASSGGTTGGAGGAGARCATPDAACAAFPPAAWARLLGGSNGNGRAVALDAAGRVFATGIFSGSADLGSGPIVAQGAHAAYVVAWGPGGDVLWTRAFDGVTDVMAAVTEASGVYVVGLADGAVDFGGGPRCAAGAGTQRFLLKLDMAGKHLWSTCLGDANVRPGEPGVTRLAADAAGGVVFSADFVGSVDFGTGPVQVGALGSSAVAKRSASGVPVWTRVFSSVGGFVAISSVAVGPDGSVYVVGRANGTIDLGGGPLTTADYYGDAFLAKLDANGEPLWSKVFPSPKTETDLKDVAVDGSGRCVIGGEAWIPVDFGCGLQTPQGDAGSAFVASFEGSGAPRWSRLFAGSATVAMAVDVDGTIALLTEAYDGTDFGCGPVAAGASWGLMLLRLDAAGRALGDTSLGIMPPSLDFGVAARDGVIVVTGQRTPDGSYPSEIDGASVTGTGAAYAVLMRP